MGKGGGPASGAAVFDWPKPSIVDSTMMFNPTISIKLARAREMKRVMSSKWLGNKVTNNVAELEAVQVALDCLEGKEPLIALPPASVANPHTLTIFTDNRTARGVLSGDMVAKSNTAIVNRIRDHLSDLFTQHIHVKLVWQPRLTALNHAADALSKQCVLLNADLDALVIARRREAQKLRGLPRTPLPPKRKKGERVIQMMQFLYSPEPGDTALDDLRLPLCMSPPPFFFP